MKCLCHQIPERLVKRLLWFMQTGNLYQLRQFEKEILSFIASEANEAELVSIDHRLEI